MLKLTHRLLAYCLAGLLLLPALVRADFLGGSAAVLPVDEAIQFSLEDTPAELILHWQLADTVYLYRDKLHLRYADKTEFSDYKFNEEAVVLEDPGFGNVAVFFEKATTVIDKSKLKSGTTSLSLKYQGCQKSVGLCYPPQTTQIEFSVYQTAAAAAPEVTPAKSNLDNAQGITAFLNESGPLVIMLTFLLLGIGLTFTPCVLPMVPILSSIIAGQNQLTARRGFMLSSSYVLGMASTFAIAGTVVGLLGARFNLQIYMQNPWVLSVFAGLFVLLALSMFGLYELRLPRFIQEPLDRLNQQQQGGKFISVFVMGALSAVVVSPCVSAPLAGALVYISTTGDAVLGGFSLFALGLGMGLPLIAIGTTGAKLMPKAGGWMEQVKYFFGVLLLAIAIWLLGRFINTHIYLALWIVLLVIYATVLGAFEAASSTAQRIIKGIGLLLVLSAIILALNFAPNAGQQNTSFNNTTRNMPAEMGNTAAAQASAFTTISTQDVFKQALTAAKNEGKITIVDVYADWCIECKIMADTTFKSPAVVAELEHFKAIKLDITAFDEFHKNFLSERGIFGPPAILFFGFDGNEISEARILGEISEADLLRHLNQFEH